MISPALPVLLSYLLDLRGRLVDCCEEKGEYAFERNIYVEGEPRRQPRMLGIS
jgi:hypothetical protein